MDLSDFQNRLAKRDDLIPDDFNREGLVHSIVTEVGAMFTAHSRASVTKHYIRAVRSTAYLLRLENVSAVRELPSTGRPHLDLVSLLNASAAVVVSLHGRADYDGGYWLDETASRLWATLEAACWPTTAHTFEELLAFAAIRPAA